MRTPINRKARRHGMTLVEAALVISTVFLLLFGIFEYGRFIMTRQVLESAAREGARYAAVHTHGKNTADVQDYTFTALADEQIQLEGFSKTSNISVYRANSDGSTYTA